MNKKDISFAPFVVVIIAAALRLLPHIPNVAPIAAMALFGGVYLNKKYAIVVLLAAMFVSDIFLGFHAVMPFVYGSFLLTGLLGLWLKKHKSVQSIIGTALLSSFLFYVFTNFGVWVMGSMYPKTLSGLIECYVSAVPFFRNTILGDLFYTAIVFGGYEAVVRIVKGFRFSTAQ